MSSALNGPVQALGAVSPTRLGMYRSNFHPQPFILQRSPAKRTFLPSIKTAARYRQNPAQQLEWVLISPLLHERVPGSVETGNDSYRFKKRRKKA
jgi:hypothetical protein